MHDEAAAGAAGKRAAMCSSRSAWPCGERLGASTSRERGMCKVTRVTLSDLSSGTGTTA